MNKLLFLFLASSAVPLMVYALALACGGSPLVAAACALAAALVFLVVGPLVCCCWGGPWWFICYFTAPPVFAKVIGGLVIIAAFVAVSVRLGADGGDAGIFGLALAAALAAAFWPVAATALIGEDDDVCNIITYTVRNHPGWSLVASGTAGCAVLLGILLSAPLPALGVLAATYSAMFLLANRLYPDD